MVRFALDLNKKKEKKSGEGLGLTHTDKTSEDEEKRIKKKRHLKGCNKFVNRYNHNTEANFSKYMVLFAVKNIAKSTSALRCDQCDIKYCHFSGTSFHGLAKNRHSHLIVIPIK